MNRYCQHNLITWRSGKHGSQSRIEETLFFSFLLPNDEYPLAHLMPFFMAISMPRVAILEEV